MWLSTSWVAVSIVLTANASTLLRTKRLVPKKGLEPPRPCGHMDLNHARLPIPPLRLSDWDAAGSRVPDVRGSILAGCVAVSNSESSLDFRSGFQLYVALVHFNAVFHGEAAVLFAELIGFLLHERRKTIQSAGYILPGLSLRLG